MIFGIEYKFWWLVLFIIAFCFVPFLYFWKTQDKWKKECEAEVEERNTIKEKLEDLAAMLIDLDATEVEKCHVVKPTEDNRGFYYNRWCIIQGFQTLQQAKNAFSLGEWYATKEEAEHACKARKVRKRLVDFIAELNNGQKPDFTGAKQGRYWMLLDHEDKMVYLKDFHSFQIASKDLVFLNPDHMEDITANFSFEELEMALNA